MTKNLYYAVVVLLRLAGLYFIFHSFYGFVVQVIFARTQYDISLRSIVTSIFFGLILWLVAKPCANYVTTDLD